MSYAAFLRPVVFAILEDESWNILLSERANTGWNDGWYGLPSGHMEPMELPSEAMSRETMEEIGVQPTEWTHLSTLFRLDGDQTYVNCFYHVTKWDGEIRNAEPEKCAGIKWYPRRALPENTIPFIREVIESDMGCSHFSETRVG